MITVARGAVSRSHGREFFLRSTIGFLFFLWGTASAWAQNISVQGKDWGYLTTIPPTWVQDRRSLYNEGIEGLFLPQGKEYGIGIPRILIIPPEALYTFTPLPGALKVASAETASFQTVDLYSQSEPGSSPNNYCSLYGRLNAGSNTFTFLLVAPSQDTVDARKEAFIQIIENFVLLGKN